MKKYGIVLVGCGYMGASHMEDIYYRDNIEVIGVADVDPKKAEDFARKYGARSWKTDYKAYTADPAVDIVIIATYPSTHLAILRDCLAHGKNVICEKPITADPDEARRFVNLVEESAPKVLVGHILRHNSTYGKVAQMIHEGAIGSPIVIRMVQNKHTMEWNRYLQLINETSPLIDCGVHYFDIMQWFCRSNITEVSGICTSTEPELDNGKYNYSMVCVKLADGSVGYYESAWGNTVASEDIKEFIGPKGRIKIVYSKDRAEHSEEGDLIEYYNHMENKYEIINNCTRRKPTWEQLSYLIRMIEEEAQAVPSMSEVLRSYHVALAADKAVRTGKTVML